MATIELPMLPRFKDFLTLSGVIAAVSVLLGSAIGIHSLRQPQMSKGRWLALSAYAFLAVLVSVGLLFNGAYQEQHTREIDGKIDTIRAVLGSAPGTSGEEVLKPHHRQIQSAAKYIPATNGKDGARDSFFERQSTKKNYHRAHVSPHFQAMPKASEKVRFCSRSS